MKKLSFVLVFCALFICLLFNSNVSAQFASTDFLIADSADDRIAVYDQNLVFLRYLDTGFNQVSGLTILSSGSLAAAGRNPGRIKVYNPSGMIVTDFTDPNIGDVVDLKASPLGRLYVGSQSATSAVAEFTQSGTFLRNLGVKAYSGVAVLPGNVLWASEGTNTIDVFDIISGTLTSTITLDNGQLLADSMFYSPSTNTVLITDFGTNSVFERTTTGAFVRQFTGGGAILGVTRGPGGDVFSTEINQVHRWTLTGMYLGSTNISANVTSAVNIVWAANLAPTAASATVSGRVTDASGRGIARAIVSLTGPSGAIRTFMTNTFGYFRFEEVAVGNSYVFEIRHKQYRFTPRVININEDIEDLNFTAK
jgi:hypothetical protein